MSTTGRSVVSADNTQNGTLDPAGRAFQAASTLLSGILAITVSQALGAPLKLMDPKAYKDYITRTKESFAILMTSVTQWWSPTVVRVSGDDSMKGQLFQMPDGSLKCNFPHRMVLMANHQLYTDWLYLWWTAYTNKMHGYIYIIMKESLKQLPIIGWSGQLYNFIFLSRKWETDENRFRQALGHLCNPKDPMWLLIFPEGTNLSSVTREKSAQWAKKTGTPDMKHQLLPRAKGLEFCLRELRSSTNWLYDCTIAYEGVPEGSYGQDIFTLRSSFLEGKPPKSVNMHWRRFRISEIPTKNSEQFARWLTNRWREKDYMLEYFSRHGKFPAGQPSQTIERLQGKLPVAHTKSISTHIQGDGWEEFLGIFEPITSVTEMMSKVDMTEPINPEAILQKVMQSGMANNALSLGKSLGDSQKQKLTTQALQQFLAMQGPPKAIKGTVTAKTSLAPAKAAPAATMSMTATIQPPKKTVHKGVKVRPKTQAVRKS